MTDVLDRARADLAAGRVWKARDRLTGALGHRQDAELLDLLAMVHQEMGDLPAAGALWFVLGRQDETRGRAVDAWRERFSSDEARWFSLPAPLRRNCFDLELHELHEAAWAAAAERRRRARATPEGHQTSSFEGVACGVIGVLIIGAIVALIVIGGWTAAGWLWG